MPLEAQGFARSDRIPILSLLSAPGCIAGREHDDHHGWAVVCTSDNR